jgi:large exoprotein involved in heme utilization and adhesion
LFGIQPRSQATPLSDIVATGGVNFRAGQININRSQVDAESGLVSQDTEVVDTSNLITQTCGKEGKFAAGEFIITGRSGLPTDPTQNANLPEALADFGLVSPPSSSPNSGEIKTSPPTIVEAQGWKINAAGEIELFAQVPSQQGFLPPSCLPEKN